MGILARLRRVDDLSRHERWTSRGCPLCIGKVRELPRQRYTTLRQSPTCFPSPPRGVTTFSGGQPRPTGLARDCPLLPSQEGDAARRGPNRSGQSPHRERRFHFWDCYARRFCDVARQAPGCYVGVGKQLYHQWAWLSRPYAMAPRERGIRHAVQHCRDRHAYQGILRQLWSSAPGERTLEATQALPTRASPLRCLSHEPAVIAYRSFSVLRGGLFVLEVLVPFRDAGSRGTFGRVPVQYGSGAVVCVGPSPSWLKAHERPGDDRVARFLGFSKRSCSDAGVV